MKKDELIKRGLKDLIKENELNIKDNEEVVNIELDKIKANPFQPRKHFDKSALKELSDSIRMNGVLQPIIVKKINNGYLLVAGERRCRASEMAGFRTIPAIIRDYNDQYLAELALLENIQREDLTIVEEAKAYKNVIDTLDLTHLELANKIGKSRSYVSNALGILSLPDSVIQEINEGNITMGHARSLSKLKDNNRIIKIAQIIIEKKLTVRDIEQLVKKEKKKKQIKRRSINIEFQKNLIDTKEIMSKKLHFKNDVKISSNKIIITIQNQKELQKLKKLLEGDGSNG
ncbi:MAG TPA: ParB/RepB/Spo0J family partition protein [Candidatus Izemoplasmatales bacterium]|nr:ParB/RepB/Spo0J family partition protein [Candidatus Izemoplasmatales bacterium]